MSGRWNARISDGNSSTTPLAAAGAAAPTFRAVAGAQAENVTSLAINKPAGVVTDDVMIAAIYWEHEDETRIVTLPAGWTLIRSDFEPGNEALLYWKRAGSSEPANYTWTLNVTTNDIHGVIVAYDNIVATGDPVNAHGGLFQQELAPDDITAPSINVTTGSMLVAIFSLDADTNMTPPAGMTQRYDVASLATSSKMVADQTFSAGGETGNRVATLDAIPINLSPEKFGQMVALTPAVTGGGGTFFGGAEEILDYSALRIVAEADKFGTLDVEFSTDGTNWRKTDSFPTVRSTLDPVGETSRSELVAIRARFARVNFRNGSAAQGFFRLQTILVPEADQPLPRVPERYRVHQAIVSVAAGAFADVLTLTGEDKERAIEVVAYGAVPNQPTLNTAAQFPYTMQVSRAGQVVQRTVIRNNVDTWQHVRFETSGLEVKIAVMHNELTSQSFFAFLNVREP